MSARSDAWQLLSALGIAVVVLLVTLGVGYYAYRADEVLGHGPLPSSVSGGGAYVITVLVGALAVIVGGVAVVGLTQTRLITGRFYWLPHGIVVAVLLAVLLVPLQQFGTEPWGGLALFLVSVPTRMVLGVALGFLVFSGIGPILIPLRWRRIGEASTRSAPAAIGGLAGRFTPSAWRVLSHMQEGAKRFEHAFMGTEHLLLAMVQEPQSLAARAMVNLGVDLEEVRFQVERVLGRRGALYTGAQGLTARCRRVIEQAARLARESDNRTVGTGHLLLGLMLEPEDAASQLLDRLGVAAGRVDEELGRLGYDTEEATQPGER